MEEETIMPKNIHIRHSTNNCPVNNSIRSTMV
jgi:hypothetical protein